MNVRIITEAVSILVTTQLVRMNVCVIKVSSLLLTNQLAKVGISLYILL